MPFLAGSVCYNTPLIVWFNTISGSNFVKRLVLASLSPDMRCSYQSATCSSNYFTLNRSFNPWLTTMEWLEKKAAICITGFQVNKQWQVLTKTIFFYFSLLWIHYIDHRMVPQLFEVLKLSFLIKSGKQSFPHI